MRKKIYPLHKLTGILNDLNNDQLILACGCFDIFHIGHLEYLEGAKALGGILIVGVNSDSSIKTIKNKEPFFNEYQRSKIIESLECVDYVFIFREDTADNALLKLTPDIFAKGIDYKGKHIIESSTADNLGIKVVLVGDVKKASSSHIYRLLLERTDYCQ